MVAAIIPDGEGETMLALIDSKAGMVLVICLYSAALTYIGFRDLSRNTGNLFQVAPRDGTYANDRMIEALHGDVELGSRAVQRRRQRERALEQREESYDGFRRYMSTLMP